MEPVISMYSTSNSRISGISGVAWFFEMFWGVDLKSKQNIVIVFNFFKIKTNFFLCESWHPDVQLFTCQNSRNLWNPDRMLKIYHTEVFHSTCCLKTLVKSMFIMQQCKFYNQKIINPDFFSIFSPKRCWLEIFDLRFLKYFL